QIESRGRRCPGGLFIFLARINFHGAGIVHNNVHDNGLATNLAVLSVRLFAERGVNHNREHLSTVGTGNFLFCEIRHDCLCLLVFGWVPTDVEWRPSTVECTPLWDY